MKTKILANFQICISAPLKCMSGLGFLLKWSPSQEFMWIFQSTFKQSFYRTPANGCLCVLWKNTMIVFCDSNFLLYQVFISTKKCFHVFYHVWELFRAWTVLSKKELFHVDLLVYFQNSSEFSDYRGESNKDWEVTKLHW